MLARLSGLQSAGTRPPIVRLREEVVAKPDSYLRSDSEAHPAAVLGEIDRLFSKGGLRELKGFTVRHRFDPDLARVRRRTETAWAAQKCHQLAVARQRGDFGR